MITNKERGPAMMFVYPIRTLFNGACENEGLCKAEADHAALNQKMSIEIEMQRLRWEYKNMREKKRATE